MVNVWVFVTLSVTFVISQPTVVSSTVQFSSVAQSCWTLCELSMPGLTVHHQLLEPTQTDVHGVSDALLSPCPLSSPFPSRLQSLPASGSFQMSQHFAWGSQSIGVSASTPVLPSDEHPGLISFRMDWLDLLAVQETLKSLLQHHSSKATILQCSAFLGSPTLTSIHDYWKNHGFD